jgi:hypothetical protein
MDCHRVKPGEVEPGNDAADDAVAGIDSSTRPHAQTLERKSSNTSPLSARPQAQFFKRGSSSVSPGAQGASGHSASCAGLTRVSIHLRRTAETKVAERKACVVPIIDAGRPDRFSLRSNRLSCRATGCSSILSRLQVAMRNQSHHLILKS